MCDSTIKFLDREYIKGKILIIEGLISSGKSTASICLEKYSTELGVKCKYFKEPLIPELLQLFLSDQKKYAFAFQLSMVVKRQSIYREAFKLSEKGYFCIIDRSLYGDYCFAYLHRYKKNLNDIEWNTYLSVLHSEKFKPPDYVIYLKVTVETAIKRCLKRDRKGENNYDRTYFEDLNNTYTGVLFQIPTKQLIIIDWNNDIIEKEIADILLNEIKKVMIKI